METDTTVGRMVHEARMAVGLSQQELASCATELGWPIYPQTVLKIEKGQRGLKLTEAACLAGILGVAIEDLLGVGPSFDSGREAILRRMASIRVESARDALAVAEAVLARVGQARV